MGLDLSLTGTGLVVLSKSKVRYRFLPTKPLNALPKSAPSQLHHGIFFGTPEERINWIVFHVIKAWVRTQPSFVVVEEYAFSRGASQAHALGELGGVVKHYLYLGGALVHPFGIKQNKLYATDDGNATKEEMVERAQQLWSGFPTFEGNDNIADAFHLARYGFRNYDRLIEAA